MNLTGNFSILKPTGMVLSAFWPRPENRRRSERDAPLSEPVHLLGIRSEAFAEDLDGLLLHAGVPPAPR